MKRRKLLLGAGVVGVLISLAMTGGLSISGIPPPEKLPAPRVIEDPKDLSGIYLCEGVTGDEKYKGIVGVQKIKSVYVLQYLVNVSAFTGIGMAKGNQLSVSWSAQANQRGLTIYTIGTDKLAGKWSAIPGSGELNDETLTFLRPWPAQAKEEK